MNVKPLSSNSETMMESHIKKFVDKYSDGYQMFNEQNAKGLGTAEDLSVLGWMYYEGIYATEEEIVEVTAYLLGKALVRYAGFEWGEIEIADSNKIVLVHNENDYIFTPLEYVIIRLRQLWRENYEVEDLFFDAIFLLDYCDADESMHPLFAIEYIKEYQDKLGFGLPSNIIPVIEKFWKQDHELLIRKLGIEFYEEYYAKDWKKIESKFKDIDFAFATEYHKPNVWEPIYESTKWLLEIIDVDE